MNFPFAEPGGRSYTPRQTQYARASGPRPNPAKGCTQRRQAFWQPRPVASGRPTLVAGSFDRFVNLGPSPGQAARWSLEEVRR